MTLKPIKGIQALRVQLQPGTTTIQYTYQIELGRNHRVGNSLPDKRTFTPTSILG